MTKPEQPFSSELDLRWRLRQLPKEHDVAESIWAKIDARLDETPQNVQQPARAKALSMPWRVWGIAASLAAMMAMGLPLWRNDSSAAKIDPHAQIVAQQVDLMALEYQAALKQLGSVNPPSTLADDNVQAQLKLLDDSLVQLHNAIAKNPSATYLLTMLRRTYMQRLQITQHLMMS